MTRQAYIERPVEASLPETMSYETFLAWPHENPHVEWVDGKLVDMAPVSNQHNEVGIFLLRLLSDYAETRGLGVTRCEPFQMKTGPELPGRSPDVLFVANENLGRLKKMCLDGPADLVVEVVSPGYRGRDRQTKFGEYERGGVREYWVIDPEQKEAEFFVLGAEGRYEAMPVEAGVFRSMVLEGLWLRVEWLWRRPLPSVRSVCREMGLE